MNTSIQQYNVSLSSLFLTCTDAVFAANVGGTMGLCVGASLLSLCEFIDFLIVAIAYKLNTRKKIGATVENLKY